jgi:hypothetical protein
MTIQTLPGGGSSQAAAGSVTAGGAGATFNATTVPSSTTSGVQEAITSVSTVGSPYYGYTVVIIGGAVPFTTQITIPLTVQVVMQNMGGEQEGPVQVLPLTYLSFVGASTVNDTIIWNNTGVSKLWNFNVITAVTGLRSVMRMTGSRSVKTYDIFIKGPTGVIGLLMDGTTQNNEHNEMYAPYIAADPPLQFGLAGEAQHTNDCDWYSATLEGPSGTACGASGHIIYVATRCGNQRFFNEYTRGSFTAGQILIDMSIAAGGSIDMNGGELIVGPGTYWNVGGGALYLNNVTLTCTGGPSICVITGGQVNFFNVIQQTGTLQYNQSAGITIVGDALSRILGTWNWGTTSSTTNVGTGGGTVSGAGRGPWPANPGSGGVRIPAQRNTDLNSGSAPVSGTWYGPFAASGIGYTATIIVPVEVSAVQSFTVSISPDGGTTVQNQTPSTEPGVAGTYLVHIFVPNGWYFRLTATGATISAGTVLANP